jgi:hypothetical protein
MLGYMAVTIMEVVASSHAIPAGNRQMYVLEQQDVTRGSARRHSRNRASDWHPNNSKVSGGSHSVADVVCTYDLTVLFTRASEAFLAIERCAATNCDARHWKAFVSVLFSVSGLQLQPMEQPHSCVC